jgi:hypothetical protein
MNTSFQLGATIGVAGELVLELDHPCYTLSYESLSVVSAITLGVNSGRPLDPISLFTGYEASFWSLVGLHGLMILIILVAVH